MEVAWVNEVTFIKWRSPGLEERALHSQPYSPPNAVWPWPIAVPLWVSVSPLPWVISEAFPLAIVLGTETLDRWPPEVLLHSHASPKSCVLGWPCSSQRLTDTNRPLCRNSRKIASCKTCRVEHEAAVKEHEAALWTLKSLQIELRKDGHMQNGV